ncbi:hypothetical protein A1O3_06703 [Capronia epimyces CBS 606.96]|uniref:Xylanolytic transcriptional activator regulatory domain-containing protein n=1 Tax=Capronia epimyces CBS 606.96 TaxID=1182542 RepID=W9XQT6_9EURO|nr:uncharacterized protein A1O3_06703 [Capronia epimyces CBS 606.96]EXJ82887.1 hypothetical protein A1O3_06703 [Capronia epimyces CBS 606.96]
MTALSLFHQPSFGNKLTNIPSVTQLVALLASILSFSARYRFDPSGNSARPEDGEPLDDSLGLSLPPQYFEALSQQYVDEALKEHSHDAPPLCVLQALVLLTFQELIKGARGSAWRRLGVCVRVAYELDLHHVDRGNTPEQTDPQIWTEIEERRRTWWFIWEMDVFASTIRRCPAAIDWRDNETRFPVCDEDWFARTFQPSCFLETKPLDRLRVLQQCGTQSPKAWFIVLNSFMLEGHMFSKFRSPRPGGGKYGPSRPAPRDSAKDNTESLAILANALRCFGMALPKRLRHRDQFLSFGDNDPATRVATRQLHSAMYSIHVTTQLTRMMINHQDAYRGAQQDLRLNENDHTDGSATAEGGSVSLHLGPTRQGMQQYIEAADELLHIVSRSSEHHVRYVNPFLASTLWYGAVVHLGWKVLAPPHTNLDFIESKFAVMHMILTEFANFWDLPSTLQENLSGVEGKLSLFTRQQARRSSHSSGRVRNQGGSGGTAVNPPNGTSSTTALTTDGSSSSASEVLAANTMINLANDQAQHAGRASSIPHRPSTVTNNSNPNPGPGPGPGQGPGPESTDWLPPNTTGSSYCRRDSQTVFTPRSITVRGANSNYPNTGGSTGGGGDDQFIFDDSWLMTTSGSGGGGSNNMAVLNETFPAQDNAAHPPRGLWDDLQLDLDFAMDPESLFQGIMNYN